MSKDIEDRAIFYCRKFMKDRGVDIEFDLDDPINRSEFIANDDFFELVLGFLREEGVEPSKEMDISSFIPNRSVVVELITYPIFLVLGVLRIVGFPRSPFSKPRTLTPRILASFAK